MDTDRSSSAWLLTVVLAGFLASTELVRAGVARLELTDDCYCPIGPSCATPDSKDDTGVGTPNYSEGWLFTDEEVGPMYCSLTVPEDYDEDSTSEPQVVIFGWSTADLLCVFDCGTEQRFVNFAVSSVAYPADVLVDDAFPSPSNASGTWDADYVAGDYYWRSDKLKEIRIDATTDAANWAAGEFLIIRIDRQESVGDNLARDFHAANIHLRYVTN